MIIYELIKGEGKKKKLFMLNENITATLYNLKSYGSYVFK